MERVLYIIYRYLSRTDFFNIYKPSGTEPRGGGQKYIDVRTSGVSVSQWRKFFKSVRDVSVFQRARGPRWEFPIYSIGLGGPQEPPVAIYQRRATTVCIASQNLESSKSNRIKSWHPKNGFPEPLDKEDRHQLPTGLGIFLVRTVMNKVWAGWFINPEFFPARDEIAARLISQMIDPSRVAEDDGFLEFADASLHIDIDDPRNPFVGKHVKRKSLKQAKKKTVKKKKPPKTRHISDADLIRRLFSEDESADTHMKPAVRKATIQIRKRNVRAVKDLKELYNYRCQITGDEFIFKKKNGVNYTEAHHLVPLGEGGADDPRNIIIVSSHIHSMLHYAGVSDIDLSEIIEREDGYATLDIEINRKKFTVRWHPEHANMVKGGR